MDQMEQMMMQLWLGSLKAKLENGEVDSVITELDIALGRIEEDRNVIGANDRGESESAGGSSGDPAEEDESSGEDSEPGRVHDGAVEGGDQQSQEPIGEVGGVSSGDNGGRSDSAHSEAGQELGGQSSERVAEDSSTGGSGSQAAGASSEVE